eukprot:scaffold52938_cov22-Tisochrysis_lutea.AAC.3
MTGGVWGVVCPHIDLSFPKLGGEIRKRAVLFGIHAKSGAFLSMLRAGKRVHDTLQIAKGMDHIVQCGQGNCGSAAL